MAKEKMQEFIDLRFSSILQHSMDNYQGGRGYTTLHIECNIEKKN